VLPFGAPYSTTNKGEVWAQQQTKNPEGLRMTVLAIAQTSKQKYFWK